MKQVKSKVRQRTLSSKIAGSIGLILFVIFAIFIAAAVFSAQSALQSSAFRELQSLTRESSAEIEAVLDTAITSTENMSRYMQDTYSVSSNSAKAINVSSAAENSENVSQLFPSMVLSRANKNIEDFLINTARYTVENNPDIFGVGVFFEPFSFTTRLESYSLYASQNTDGTVKVGSMGDYGAYSKTAYYTLMQKEKAFCITEPTIDPSTNVLMITVMSPVLVNNEFKGLVCADISIENFSRIAVVNANYPSIYNTIANQDQTLIYHSKKPEKVGMNNSSTFLDAGIARQAADTASQGNEFYIHCKNAENVDVYKFYAPIPAGNVIWWSTTTVEGSDLMAETFKTMLLLAVLAVGALVVLILFTTVILKRQLKPISGIVKAAQDLSQGNLDIHLDVKSQDEIGVLSATFNDTADYLNTIINEIARILEEIAQNNLDLDSGVTFRGAFKRISLSLQNILKNLNSVMGNISRSADQVANGSEQVSGGAQALSQGATEQASAIEQLSASINEISGQVQANASNASEASGEALSVGQEANESNRRMQEMLAAMSEINTSAGEIGKIIKTIEDIAFQTNILALNAAVEAARAGDAGKGFAVVADEVRSLASKSGEASKNTSELIEKAIRAVETGTSIADETAQSLATVVEGVKQVGGTIHRISQASGEQAESITQITQGVDQISSVIQTNSATAQESAAASEELSGQAALLKNLVGQFRLQGSAGSAPPLPSVPPALPGSNPRIDSADGF